MDRDEFAHRLEGYRDKYSLDALAACLGVNAADIIRFFEGYDICEGRYQLAADQLAALNVKAMKDAEQQTTDK